MAGKSMGKGGGKRAASPKLTAAKRRALPASSFALPSKNPRVKGAKGDYPMDTPGRARNALARVKQNGTVPEQKTVQRRVAAKYPSINVTRLGKKKSK